MSLAVEAVSARRTSRTLAVVAFALLVPHLGACGEAKSPAPPADVGPAWPEGTVLSIGSEGITAEEIDRFTPTIALVEPQFVEADHRRKALAEIVLPMAAARVLLPSERDAAFREAQLIETGTRETGAIPEGAPAPSHLTGNWHDVGLVPWGLAADMEPGTFSPLFETPGAWTFFKLLACETGPGEAFGPGTRVTLVRYDFPFMDREALGPIIREGLDAMQVRVVDPEWERVVPPHFMYPKSGAQ